LKEFLEVNRENEVCFVFLCRPFGGRFTVRKVVGSRFIIISGNLTYRTVQDFLSEFYHPIHNQGFFLPSFFFGVPHTIEEIECNMAINRWTQEKRLEAKKVHSFGTMMHCIADMDAFPLRIVLMAPYKPS